MGRARPTADNNPLAPLPHWLVREWLGFVLVGVYLFVLPVDPALHGLPPDVREHGRDPLRASWSFLLLFMALMPIKMVLRWLFNLKYFIYLPEFNANL